MAVLKIESVEQFKDLVSNNNKVLVDFYADWCGPCRMMGPVVEEISNENSSTVVAKVNVDDLGELAEMFGIFSIPTLIVFNGGNLKTKFTGVTNKAALVDALK